MWNKTKGIPLSRFAVDSSICAAINILVNLFSVISSIIIAKYGGVEVKGSVSYVLASSALLSLLTNPGIGWYFTDLYNNNRKTEAVEFIIKNQLMQVALSLVISSLASQLIKQTWQICILSLLFSVNTALSVICLNVIGPMVPSISSLLQSIVPLASIVALLIFKMLNTNTIIACYASGFLCSTIYLIRKSWPFLHPYAPNRTAKVLTISVEKDLSHLLNSIKNNMTRTLQYAITRIDVILISLILGPSQAGIYSVGYSTTDLFMLVPSQLVVNSFFRLKKCKDSREWTKILLFLAAIVSICGSICYYAAPPLITAIYGSDYFLSGSIARICILASGSLVFVRLSMLIIRVSSRPTAVLVPSLSILLMIVFLIPYSAYYGLTRAASVYSIACFVYFLLTAYSLYKLKFNYEVRTS